MTTTKLQSKAEYRPFQAELWMTSENSRKWGSKVSTAHPGCDGSTTLDKVIRESWDGSEEKGSAIQSLGRRAFPAERCT